MTTRTFQVRWPFRKVIVVMGLLVVVIGIFVAGRLWLTESGEIHSGQSNSGTPFHKPLPPDESYIGSAACAECHSEVSEAYQTHPMAHSLHTVIEAPLVEDYDDRTSFSASESVQYRVEKTPNAVFHHELKTDLKGMVLYDQGVQIHYALGSGARGRSYLTQRDGRFFVSPISWYSKNKLWGLSPGYLPGKHVRFSRRATSLCLECHSGRLAVDPERNGRFQKPAFLEASIGCESCHGPGERHVHRHRDGKDGPGPDPIVNPTSLDPARRESVCNQCHLSGKERTLRYGRTAHDFRPGQLLGEIWTIFIDGSEVGSDGRTRAVSHVEQMHSSVCAVKSNGRLGCISCHDSHSIPAQDHKAAFYRSQCMSCHQEQGCSLSIESRIKPPAENSCIHCHMPKLDASDVPHTAQTDHRILRRPIRILPKRGAVDEPVKFQIFDESSLPLLETEKARARGLMLARFAEQSRSVADARQAERLLRPLLAFAADDIAILDGLAISAVVQQRDNEALNLWKKALTIDPKDENVLFSLVIFSQNKGDLASAKNYLEQCLVLNRWDAHLHALHAQILSSLGLLDQAIESAERGLEIDPSKRDLYFWLAEMHKRKGNHKDSQRYRMLLKRFGSQ